MRNIKGILFDKDGTLIDFEATWFAIGDRLALGAADGDRAKADALLEHAGYDFANHRFKADSVFAAGTSADIVALWYPHLSASDRLALLSKFDAFTASEGAARSVPLPGVKDAIASLHRSGFRLAVATNDSTDGARKTLSALGIETMFEAAYGYDAVANPKPAPDTVHAFCERSGLRPAELAVVGDNRHDLEMAVAGGTGLAIGVLSGNGTRETLEPLADAILNSVAELPAFLRSMDRT